jgi:hypothetical protein
VDAYLDASINSLRRPSPLRLFWSLYIPSFNSTKSGSLRQYDLSYRPSPIGKRSRATNFLCDVDTHFMLFRIGEINEDTRQQGAIIKIT